MTHEQIKSFGDENQLVFEKMADFIKEKNRKIKEIEIKINEYKREISLRDKKIEQLEKVVERWKNAYNDLEKQ